MLSRMNARVNETRVLVTDDPIIPHGSTGTVVNLFPGDTQGGECEVLLDGNVDPKRARFNFDCLREVPRLVVWVDAKAVSMPCNQRAEVIRRVDQGAVYELIVRLCGTGEEKLIYAKDVRGVELFNDEVGQLSVTFEKSNGWNATGPGRLGVSSDPR